MMSNGCLQEILISPLISYQKSTGLINYKQYTELKELYRKNGFIFLKGNEVSESLVNESCHSNIS